MTKPINTTIQTIPLTPAQFALTKNDVIFSIFNFLSGPEVAKCGRVCKQWNKVAQNNRLWTLSLQRYFPHLNKAEEVKKTKAAKQVYQNRYRTNTNLTKGVCATKTMESPTSSLILTKEGQLISGSHNGLIKIWDLNTFNCVNTLQGHNGSVTRLLLTEEGQLISGSYDGTIKIWDLNPEKTNKCLNTLQGHSNLYAIPFLILTKKGQLISGSQDGTIKIWDLKSEKTDKCVNTFHGPTLSGKLSPVTSLILTEEEQLISSFFNGTIKIWDLKSEKTDKCIKAIQAHANYIPSLILTDDGHVISGSHDHSIKIWDKKGECINTLQGHHAGISCLLLSEEGHLISGHADGKITIWDLKKGRRVHILPGQGGVVSLILTKEEQLISAHSNGMIAIWDLESLSLEYIDRAFGTWDLENGKYGTILQGPGNSISCLLLTEEGQLFTGTRLTLKNWDFAASNRAIFQELAEIFGKLDSKEQEKAMERFLRMPKREREEIYRELYEILKSSSNDYLEYYQGKYAALDSPTVDTDCGEWAFLGQFRLDSTPEQKAQAITNYLNRTAAATPVEEIIEKPTEELNEVFQYFTDILQIIDKKKVIFQMSEFSAAFIEKTGLVNFVDLQTIGISPQLMEKLAQLQGQLKQLSQEGKQEQTHKHQALATITSIKDPIDSLLGNLLPMIELGREVTIPLDNLTDMQSFLTKQNALLEQIMESPQSCNQFINSGDLAKFANSLLAVVAQFEQCIKHSQIELLHAYLSQPHLNATWENLQANGITKASQLTQQPSEFYRM